MKHIIFVLLFLSQAAVAQRLKKADRAIVENLKAHIGYLADDKLEGRRTGTAGEKLAYEYISNEFKKMGLLSKGDNSGYLQQFEIDEGKQITAANFFIVNGHELKTGEEYFPLSYSANSNNIDAAVSTSLAETNAPWFRDLGDALLNNKDNPHFELQSHIREETKKAAEKGATALILFNSSATEDNIRFDAKDKTAPVSLPVIYIRKTARDKYLKDESAVYDLKLKVDLAPKKRYGHNVIGYMDNGVTSTVVFGAHYDHLGYGEDGNSMLRTGEKLIHNGADDNASGVSALIELAKLLKRSKSRFNNYLFIAFSGEELGLYGSKYFVEHPTIDIATLNYMINMDMVGRMNDSSKMVTIGGFGTSPVWSEVVYADKKIPFKIKIDSSGTGPSDHTSFYLKNIPVLFFFTGLHSDYHKPGDDVQRINYNGELQIIKYIQGLVESTGKKGKLVFTKTREQQMSTSTRFSVTMGIMPDYTFNGAGVKVDGLSEGRPAQKAGIQAGDIVTQLGEHTVNSMESYMQALSKFKKGDSTKVKVKRGAEELLFDIIF